MKFLTQESMDSLISYFNVSLGFTGTQWEGSVGDLPMINAAVEHSNTSSPMESHFAFYYRAVANNRNELKPTKTILRKFLGVTGSGALTTSATYWKTMERLTCETRQRVEEPIDVRHRYIRGVWLNILQKAKTEEEEDYIIAVGSSSFYFVKAGVPEILKISKHGIDKQSRLLLRMRLLDDAVSKLPRVF